MVSILEELKGLTVDKIVLYQEEGLLFEYSASEYIDFLSSTLDDYNFQDDFSYLLYIYLIVPHCLCATVVNKKERVELLEKLKKIREKIQVLILKKPGNINKDNPNFLLLKKLIDDTESLIIASFYDLLEKYNGNNLELIKYLLFEVKEYDLVEDIFNKYPYMIRLRDEDNVSLIERVIDNYLEEVKIYTEDKKLSTNYNLVYYDKIIDLFLSSEKLEFGFKEKMNLLSHVNYCRKSINLDEFNNLTKRKFIFWLNHLEEKLTDKSHKVTFKELCYMHDIKDGFDEGILSEARRLDKEIFPKQYQNRTLVSDEYILTIDGKGAEELDDALSIVKLESGLYKLGIHIAAPTDFLPKDSIILDGANEKGTSLYLPGNHTVNMYPQILAKDKMNLLEGKYRLAVSIYLYVNSQGKIENYEFLETIIQVNKNATYKSVDSCLKSGTSSDKRYLETITLLNEIVPKLKKNFKIDETYAFVNRTESNPSSTNVIHNTNSGKIVETCMMMANYIVAYHMNKNNLPCINRVHKLDDEYLKKLASIQANLRLTDGSDIDSAIKYLKAIYPKSKYATDITGHFGLGIDYYCHFTAPLRRYLDNIMKLYVLDPFYFHSVSDRRAYEIEDELKRLCTYTNERSVVISSFMESIKKEKVKILTK